MPGISTSTSNNPVAFEQHADRVSHGVIVVDDKNDPLLRHRLLSLGFADLPCARTTQRAH